jgi:hypothetical protein
MEEIGTLGIDLAEVVPVSRTGWRRMVRCWFGAGFVAGACSSSRLPSQRVWSRWRPVRAHISGLVKSSVSVMTCG